MVMAYLHSLLKKRWCFYAFPLLCSIATTITLAEDAPFFEKNYAIQPGADSEIKKAQNPNVAVTATAIATPRPTNASLSDQVKEIRAKILAKKAKSKSANAPVAPNGIQTMEVTEVGAILSAAKNETLIAELTDMVATLTPAKRGASVVYAIGEISEIPGQLAYELAQLGGTVRFVRELPKRYQQVKSTPTWILASNDQEILIEGSGKLSENLSPEGAIITQAREKVTPAAAGSSHP